MAKKTDENTLEDLDQESPEEALDEAHLQAGDEEYEENIPDEEGKPVRKKVAALKARHALEDYFELKKLRQELDYLLEEEKKRKEKEEARKR